MSPFLSNSLSLSGEMKTNLAIAPSQGILILELFQWSKIEVGECDDLLNQTYDLTHAQQEGPKSSFSMFKMDF